MRSRRNIARSTRPIARIAVMMLALAFAAGQIAGFAHLALVRHSHCAEHGELIDVPNAATGTAIDPQPDSDRPQFTQAQSNQDGHRHEHCTAAPQRRDKSIVAGHRPLAQIAQLGAAALQQHATRLLPSRDLYRFAPKTSPPG